MLLSAVRLASMVDLKGVHEGGGSARTTGAKLKENFRFIMFDNGGACMYSVGDCGGEGIPSGIFAKKSVCIRV